MSDVSSGGGLGEAPRTRPWFEAAFDRFYADLYAHRDPVEAARIIASLDPFLPATGPVLDIACGTGRLTRILRERYELALGVDLSFDLLQLGRSRDPDGPWVRGDMRSLPLASGRFGAAFSLFTSFGYFESAEEDWRVGWEAARLLRPGGIYVLDFLNAEVVLAGLVPESRETVAGRNVESRRRYDAATRILSKQVRVFRDGGLESEYEERVRVHTPEDLETGFALCGFVVETIFGDYDGAAFDPARSPRCIVVGRKESS